MNNQMSLKDLKEKYYPQKNAEKKKGQYFPHVTLLTPEQEISLAQELRQTQVLLWAEILTPSSEQEAIFAAIESWQPGLASTKSSNPLVLARKLAAIDIDHELQETCLDLVNPKRKSAFDLKQKAVSLRNKFVEANVPLAVSVARRFKHDTLTPDDLVQEATLGLFKAVSRFDPSRGLRFSTYATWWIRLSIGRAIEGTGRLVRVPGGTIQRGRRIHRAKVKMQGDLGRPATLEEVSAETGLAPTRINTILHQIAGYSSPLNDSDDSPDSDTLSPHDETFRKRMAATVNGLVGRLSPDQQEVISRRFGLSGLDEHTLEGTGAHLGFGKERVRQVEQMALGSLRKRYQALEAGMTPRGVLAEIFGLDLSHAAILWGACEGRTNKSLRVSLQLEKPVYDSMLRHICDSLGVETRSQAIKKAIHLFQEELS